MIINSKLRGLRVIIALLSDLDTEKNSAVDPEKAVGKGKGGLWRDRGA